MSFIRRLIVAMALLCFVMTAQAGVNPIGWTQSGSLPPIVKLNLGYAVSFTLINNMPFKMPSPLKISNNSSPSTEVTMSDSCSGLKLTSKQTCTVGLLLTPKTAGVKKLSIYVEYGSNKVQIPKNALTATTPSGEHAAIEGLVILPFSSAIRNNTTYTLSFQFTNNTGSPLSNVILTPNAGNTVGYTQTSTTCTSTLSNYCTVTGTFITTATSGAVTEGYTLTSGSLSGEAVTSTVVNNDLAPSVRNITFHNTSGQTIWYGFVGGSINKTDHCKSTTDCPANSLCNPASAKGLGLCYYPNPVPASGSYQLINGATYTVQITDYPNLPYVWSGNMAARTGCTSGTCDTGDCGGGEGACPVGQGFAQPVTLSEPTYQRNTVDSYDVSILNGINLGMSVEPTLPSGAAFGPNYNNANFPYYCQTPGNTSAVPSVSLGACNWSSGSPGFTPPTPSYVYVQPSATLHTCTTDSYCSTNYPATPTCGLAFDKSTTTLNEVCGVFLGYNTPNQVCSFANTNTTVGQTTPANPGDPYFNCDSAITGNADLSGYTLYSLYSCQAGLGASQNFGTCYNTSANPPESNTNCCGAANWWEAPYNYAVPSVTAPYVATDSAWTTLVASGIEWIKAACPTGYVYPFDDKSSGFSCDDLTGSNTVNSINYTITLYPLSPPA